MTPKLITVHCSASPDGKPVTGDSIREFHKARPPAGRGWGDIGYHAVIELDGTFYRGRSEITVGAHVEGHNTGNLGVCLVGTSRFAIEQFDALKWVLNKWSTQHNISADKIFCHYEWDTAKKQGKTCPNIPVEVIRRWFLHGDPKCLEPYLLEKPPLFL